MEMLSVPGPILVLPDIMYDVERAEKIGPPSSRDKQVYEEI